MANDNSELPSEERPPSLRSKQTIPVIPVIALLFLASLYFVGPTNERMESVISKSSEGFVRDQTKPHNATASSRNGTSVSSRSGALQMAMDFDPSSDLADYTWENSSAFARWIPARNAPHLTRRDMLQIFSNENTLWIGDSTGRQDYHTMQALLWQPEPYASDYFDLGSLDFVDASPQNHTNLLEKMKNTNHGGYDGKQLWCKAREISRKNRKFLVNVGLVAEQRHQEQCASYATNKTKAKQLPSTGKLDYAIAKLECWDKTQSNMDGHKSLLERYSVLVISNGVYYTVPSTPCTRKNGTGTPKEQTYKILDYLRDELASPSRTVIWKLFGPGTDTVRSLEQELAEAARSWFRENADAVGMELADFRHAVRERSYGKSRIGGDSNRHWGLSARLLSLDLVARVVARMSSQSARR